MRYLSLFSGIEAATVAWAPLGWECVGVAEVEPFPCAVLKHHYPTVPNLGNVENITEADIKALGHIDLVVGGFPCQDLSVAGKRQGLRNDDGTATRSGLFFTAMRLFRWSGARFCLVENVPGLFSSHGGRDFAAVVGEMAGCEFGVPPTSWGNGGAALGPLGLVEWCVLDAQFFGVPQRRRRVFALLDTGDWSSRPPILFERESLSGNPPPRREAGQGVANSLVERPDRGGGNSEGQRLIPETVGALTDGAHNGGAQRTTHTPGASLPSLSMCLNAGAMGRQDSESETLIPVNGGGFDVASSRDIAPSLTSNYGKQADSSDTALGPMLVTHSLRADGLDASEDGTGRGTPLVPVAFTADDYEQGTFEQSDVARPLTTTTDRSRAAPIIAFSGKDHGADAAVDLAPTLLAMSAESSHANGGGQIAVAFEPRVADDAGPASGGDTAGALTKEADRGDGHPCVAIGFNGRQDPVPCPELLGALDTDPSTQCVAASGVDYEHYSHDYAHGRIASSRGVAPALTAAPQASGNLNVRTGYQVRRLTPRECERLQGFPLTWETVTISACIDQQKRAVRVALSCRKWQSDALPVIGNPSTPCAGIAGLSSSIAAALSEPLVACVVRTNSEDELIRLSILGRSLWSVNGAAAASSSAPSTRPAAIAHAVALLLRDQARSTMAGKAELLLSIKSSSAVCPGGTPVGVSGRATEDIASAVSSDQNSGPFTTSDLGQLTQTCDSPTAIWCCSALRAIAGFIPSGTLPDSFSAELTLGTPYTLIPHRGKPAADGPRYKALGNSFCVPVVAWIGKRIQQLEDALA